MIPHKETSMTLVVVSIFMVSFLIMLGAVLFNKHKTGERFIEFNMVCEKEVFDHYNTTFVLVGKVLSPISSPVYRCEEYQCYSKEYLQGAVFAKLIKETKQSDDFCKEK